MIKIKIVDDTMKYLDSKSKERDKIFTGGRMKGDRSHTLVLTPKQFSSLFSPERLRLLKVIKDEKINSIYGLAKKLNRSYEAVHRDVKYLEGFGLIKIKSENENKIPSVDEKISVPSLV